MNEQIILVRINDYNDKRFSQKVLNQHGCYLVNDLPYEIEIINENSAIIHGKSMDNILFNQLIEDFRFYSPQIINYYNEENKLLKTYPNYKKILHKPFHLWQLLHFLQQLKTPFGRYPKNLTLSPCIPTI